MTNSVTVADLDRWRDSDDLLRALGALRDEQRETLQAAVRQLLDHEDPDIRQEALRWLAIRWQDQSVRDDVERFMARSEGEELRVTALYALARLSTPRTRASDTNRLIAVLRDRTEDTEVRRASYEALCILHRPSQMPALNSRFNVEKEADWTWVESLAAGNPANVQQPNP